MAIPVPLRPPQYTAWVVLPIERTLEQASANVHWFRKCVQPLIEQKVAPIPAPHGFWHFPGSGGMRYILNLDPQAQNCTCPYFTGIHPETGEKGMPHPTCKHLLAAYAFLLSIGVLAPDMEAPQAVHRLSLLWERAWAKMHAESPVASRKSPAAAVESEACVAA